MGSPLLSSSLNYLSLSSLDFFGFLNSISMESGGRETEDQKNVYSVWGLPQEDLKPRLKKLMDGLRSEFGGPEFEPHVTVVGAISLSETEALDKFKKACDGLKPYTAKVEKVTVGTFFYQCVYLLLHPTPQVGNPPDFVSIFLDDYVILVPPFIFIYLIFQVVGSSDHCCNHFGYMRSTRK